MAQPERPPVHHQRPLRAGHHERPLSAGHHERPLWAGHHQRPLWVACAVPAVLALLAVCAGAPQPVRAQTAPTQLWIDLSTSTMAGMPEFMQGGVGGAISGLFGGMGAGASQVYGHASGRFIQQGGTPGLTAAFPPSRVVDVALLNPRRPGTEAALLVPLTMGMGESLPLLPPRPGFREAGDAPAELPPLKGRILMYWGCGETVRAGQPRVVAFSTANPAQAASQLASALAGRMAPERGPAVGPQHALYPNEKNTANAKVDTSLQGLHQVRGEGVPDSMQFTLAERQDLMPVIQLQQQGAVAQSIRLSWKPVAQAQAYHLHAMGMAGADMVLWSSADNADAGLGLFDYLPEDAASRWVKERLLLSPETTQCALPQGIFAAAPGAPGRLGAEAGGAMLRMIAYGPETHISHPVRPPRAPAHWQPDWEVRVRTKSQTMALLGLDAANLGGGQPGLAGQPGAEAPLGGLPGAAGNLLRGLLGR